MHKKQYEDRKLMALTISGRDAYDYEDESDN
jgi:hypothetical protein